MDRENAYREDGRPSGCSCPTGRRCNDAAYYPPGKRSDHFPGQMPVEGPWMPTPAWLFLKPTMRRRSWWLDGTNSLWRPCWEYQHPAFVAREIMEKSFAPRPAS